MRFHRMAIALMFVVMPIGCASILVPDPSSKSPAAQQRDRNECAALAARAVLQYAWDPLADLASIRADQEAECLESRGYVTTTRVTMRASPAGDQLAPSPPDPVRYCFQQAYAWLGRYDGPIDGQSNVAWRAAQAAYLTELQIVSGHPEAPNVVRESLQRDLQTLGRADEWQACLQEAMTPRP
jgi:hypothetical protein